MDFLLTNDVELTSIPENKENPAIAELLHSTGIPRILELCRKNDIHTTFYITANVIQKKPEITDQIKSAGHEIGCHGLIHDPAHSYGLMNYSDQLKSIQKAKQIIEKAGADNIVSFRSPEAWINSNTIKALIELKFTSDSSICPQRFDGPLSHGFGQKLPWLFAPRKPYFISANSIIEPGNTNILEIPVSAYIFPFIGTTMRASPSIFSLLKKLILCEARKDPEKPMVFIFHPNECLDYDKLPNQSTALQSRNLISDGFRPRLKVKNSGAKAILLLDSLIKDLKRHNASFLTAKQYRARWSPQ